MTRMKVRTRMRAPALGVLFAMGLCPAIALAQPADQPPADQPPPAQPGNPPADAGAPAPAEAPAPEKAQPGTKAAPEQPAEAAPEEKSEPSTGAKATGSGTVSATPEGAEAEVGEKAGAPKAATPEEVAHAPYSDFVDTRLTWTFGDDDVLHATGEALPLSPNPSVGDRPQYRLFFDNLNSRFAGRENITQLVLYKKLPGYIPRLDTEAALALRLDMAQLGSQSNNVNSVLEDAGTYIRLFYRTAGSKTEPQGLALVFYPIDTDRFRLGYLYDISWGGTNARINQSIFPRLQGSAPGLKMQYDGKGYYVFAGFKTASIIQVQQVITQNASGEGSATDTVRIAETNYGFLGGAGVDLTDFLRIDAGGGYFQQGRFEDPDVLGQRVYTFGGSARIVVHQGMPVPRSADFLLYKNDPNAPRELLSRPDYHPGKVSWSASLEGDRLEQHLKNFDAPGQTTMQPATAAAVQVNVQAGYLRGSISGIYRDLAYVLRNQPSFIPFQTLPKDATIQNELFGAASVDYYIEKLHLTPGVGGGVQLPATFGSSSVDFLGNNTSRTIVVRQQGDLAFLPAGESRVPIIEARGSLKWDLSDMLSTVAWVQYRRDNNVTRLELDPSGTVLLRRFLSPDFVGFGAMLQARF